MALNLNRLSKIASGKKSVLNTEGKILDIELDKIKPDPNQPRKQFNDAELSELSASIQEYGLLQPIVVRANSDDTFTIISGERRFRASQLLQAKSIKAIVNTSIAAENISYAQMAENLKRSSLTVVEVADFICERISLGEKQVEIAEKLGLEKALVSKYSAWKEFPEEIQSALAEKKINSIQTAYILYKKWIEHPSEVETFLEGREFISKAEANNFNPQSCSGTTFSTESEDAADILPQEQNEKIEGEQIEFSDKETVAEESQAEADEFFPGVKIDESCYQPLEDQNEIDNEQEENAEEAFKESPSEDSFDDVEPSVESFPDEETKEQLYKKPIIFCLVDGRECELLYKRKASDGIVCVKFEDGSEQEVIAEEVQLNRICES